MTALALLLLAATAAPLGRLDQLVEANVIGTQAYQIGLARKDGKSDAACYPTGSPTDAQLSPRSIDR